MLQVVSELKIEDQSEMLRIPKEIEIYDKETLVERLTWEGLKFPMITKPLVTDVWAKSHKTALVFNHDGLKKAEVNRRRRSGDKSASEVLPLMKLLSASFDASTHVNAAVALLKVSKHGNDRIVINECVCLVGWDNYNCRKKIGAVAIFWPFFFSKSQRRVTGAGTIPLLIDILNSGKTEIIMDTLVILDNLANLAYRCKKSGVLNTQEVTVITNLFIETYCHDAVFSGEGKIKNKKKA